jgi:dolichol kinase
LADTSISPGRESGTIGDSSGFSQEVIRKLVHFTGLSVPIIYYFTPRLRAIVILAAITMTGVVLDLTRHRHSETTRIFDRLFVYLLRAHEKDAEDRHLNAVTWFFMAATVSAAVFPKYITMVSITIALFGDAASALIGRRFGRTRFRGKSLEGSAAFYIVGLLTMLLLPKIGYSWSEYLIGAGAVLAGTAAELTPTEIVDDNFIVPLSIAGTMWLLYWLFLPGLNLHYGI